MSLEILEKVLNTNNPVLSEELKSVKNNPIFQEVMQDVKEEFFLDDKTHGLLHNERVALLACIIGTNKDLPVEERLSNEDLRLVLAAALYHDIGRGFRSGNHGLRSAIYIERNKDYIFPSRNYTDEQVNIIQALCDGHSVDDELSETVAKKYGIQDITRFTRLLSVLKDADALDRVRNRKYGTLKMSYLRSDVAKSHVEFAKEVLREYEIATPPTPSNVNDKSSTYVFHQGLQEQLLSDGEYYYLVRSLNREDIKNISRGEGIIPKVKNQDSYTLQDILEQIKVTGHRNTSLTSLSEDPNVALTYDKNYEHRFVLIRFSKEEITNYKKIFSVGEYLLGVMSAEIERITSNGPEYLKPIMDLIDSSEDVGQLVKNIKTVDEQIKSRLIERERQNLTSQEQLEQCKIIAKCLILNYYGLMRGIARDEERRIIDIGQYVQMMRVGYTNSEWLYHGNIEQERIADIPQIIVNALAMIKQAEFQGEDSEALKRLEENVLKACLTGKLDNNYDYQLEYTPQSKMRNNITISDAYGMTDIMASYMDLNMHQIAIRTIAEMELNRREIIQLLKKISPDIDVDKLLSNTLCINKDMVTRQNNTGSQFGKNVSFVISGEGYILPEKASMKMIDRVKALTNEQLREITLNGLQSNILLELLSEIKDDYGSDRELRTNINKTQYIVEAIVDGYDWAKDGRKPSDKEKRLIRAKILHKENDGEDLYKLYKALNSIQIGERPFTQNEIFSIIINIALDGKIGNIQYNDLLKKDIEEIRTIILRNQESLKVSVSEISINILAKGGRKIDEVKQELANMGLEKDFIDSKKDLDLYLAKKIVDNYEFDENISSREKVAIIQSILRSSALSKSESGGLSNILVLLRDLSIPEEDISGFIIYSAINSRNGPLPYNELLFSSIIRLEEAFKDCSFDRDVVTDISNMDILKSLSDNLSEADKERLRRVRKNLGLDDLFNPPITEKNIFVAEEIVKRYCSRQEGTILTDEDKKSVLFQLLNVQSLQQSRGGCTLINLMQYVEKIGLEENQIYSFMMDLAIKGYALDDFSGTDYNSLLQNTDNACELLSQNPNDINSKIYRSIIVMARARSLTANERTKILEESNQFDPNEEIRESKNKSNNIFVVKALVEDFCRRKDIDEARGRILLNAIIRNNQNVIKMYDFAGLLYRLEKVGFSFDQAEEMMIKMSIEDRVLDIRGYSFSSLLGTKNKVSTVYQNREKFDMRVTDKTFIRANQILSPQKQTSIDDIEDELIAIGINSEFIEQIHDENLITAKEIVDNYPFERELDNTEKAAIITTILQYPGAGKTDTRYLKNLIKTIELMGFSQEDTYGIIINSSISGANICKGASLHKVMSKNKIALKNLEKYIKEGNEIKTKVDEKTIRTMVLDYTDPFGISESPERMEQKYAQTRAELVKMGFTKEQLDNVIPQNLLVAKELVNGYSFPSKKDIGESEKKALIHGMIRRSQFTYKRHYYLYSLVRELLTEGVDEQKARGLLIRLFVNNSVNKDLRVDNIISSPKKLIEFIRNNPGAVEYDVTDDIIEKAVKNSNPKVNGKDLIREGLRGGNGISRTCDDVEAEINGLIDRGHNVQNISGES